MRAAPIGFVFQQFFLAEHASTLDNVADGLLYAGTGLAARRQPPPRHCAGSGSATSCAPGRRNCRAGSGSGSRWPARWQAARTSC